MTGVIEESTHASRDVSSELSRRGWTLARSSERAALWTMPSTSAELYVPHGLQRDSLEWDGVLERIAAPTREDPRAIEKAIELLNFDVMRFRVNASGSSIPLESASTVIRSAYGMIRAAATTARRPQQTIHSYSKRGDEIASSARLGHTEAGSFVFPVMLHVDLPAPAKQPVLDSVREVVPESGQRRVSRTLAQALNAVEKQIILPGREPRAKDLMPVVYAGGTKELLTKVATALAEPDIAFLETSFLWAGSEPASTELPRRIAVPADARELMTQAAQILGDSKRKQVRVLVGPIIRIQHVGDEAEGEIVVQAAGPEGGRRSRVEMRVRAKQLGELHEWMHRGTTVVVEGVVKTKPGRYNYLDGIVEPRPLSATLEGVE